MTTAQTVTPADTAVARRAMIDSQLRPSGVNAEGVLAAMNRVAREDFVPAAEAGLAYIDRALPLGNGRFLAAPLFHGLMLEEAKPEATDRTLVVSGGTGYLAALVQSLVTSLDVVDAAATGDARGPYDLILIDGAAEQLPDSFGALLTENGRLVTGVIDRGVTRLATGRRVGEKVALYPLAETGIPVLSEFAAPKTWKF